MPNTCCEKPVSLRFSDPHRDAEAEIWRPRLSEIVLHGHAARDSTRVEPSRCDWTTAEMRNVRSSLGDSSA
jgi:hypothetical protein